MYEIYAFVSRSISKRVCDSLNCRCFFACTVASVKNSVDEMRHIQAPTTPRPKDQPVKMHVNVECIVRTCFVKYATYQRNYWHALASICPCSRSMQIQLRRHFHKCRLPTEPSRWSEKQVRLVWVLTRDLIFRLPL